jgi:cytidylate kinase
MQRVVTIDGPAGAGKSTVARQLADRLGWRFLDTGAMYRAVTLAALRAGVDLANDAALNDLVRALEVSFPPGKVFLGKEDVTDSLRTVAVTQSSRFIADSPSVRQQLTALQREIAAREDIVTEGRDQGTLVFPDAFRKYYLTASDEERARRRVADYAARHETTSFEAVLNDLRARDARDATREIAPMKPAADAIILDSTGLSVEDVVERMALEVLGKPRAVTRAREQTETNDSPGGDRSRGLYYWYRAVQFLCAGLSLILFRWRARGQANIPPDGGVLLVCNHVSFLDVFFLGIPLERPLNYMARSTLFVSLLGVLIRSVGGFPIQREGIGASGMKETLKRLKAGGIVALFPEGTRSPDGELGPLKPGIAALAARVGVPVVPASLAGLYESWPRTHLVPVPHPVRVHYGQPILPHELAGLSTEAATELIRTRMQRVHEEAQQALRGDMYY